MSDLFDNTSAAKVASLISGQPPDQEENPVVHSVSLRIPVRMAASLFVMASQAGRSRNEMANLILDAGLTAIFREMPQEAYASLNLDIQDAISDF